MAASYPSATRSFTTKVDGPGNVISASHVNDLQDEVIAIENALRAGITHDLLFTDGLYDIGKSGATRPRDLFLSRNLTVGNDAGISGSLTVTGAANITGALNGTSANFTSAAVAGGNAFTHTGTGITRFALRNSVAGTGTGMVLDVGNDVAPSAFEIVVPSSTYAGSGILGADIPAIYSTRPGGINIGTTAAGHMGMYTSNLIRAVFPSDGGFGLVDGVAAPATLAGYAILYVDTADGDLKVKFGDGTVKTITVDT